MDVRRLALKHRFSAKENRKTTYVVFYLVIIVILWRFPDEMTVFFG